MSQEDEKGFDPNELAGLARSSVASEPPGSVGASEDDDGVLDLRALASGGAPAIKETKDTGDAGDAALSEALRAHRDGASEPPPPPSAPAAEARADEAAAPVPSAPPLAESKSEAPVLASPQVVAPAPAERGGSNLPWVAVVALLVGGGAAAFFLTRPDASAAHESKALGVSASVEARPVPSAPPPPAAAPSVPEPTGAAAEAEAAAVPEPATEAEAEAEASAPEQEVSAAVRTARPSRRRSRAKAAARSAPTAPSEPAAPAAPPPAPPPAPEKKAQPSDDRMASLLDKALGGARPAAAPAAPPPPVATEKVPDVPGRDAVRRSLAGLLPQLRQCAQQQVGMAMAAIMVKNDGSVLSASISGQPFGGTPQGACMEKVVKKARFPRFKRPTFRVSYPFSIR